MDLDRKTAHCMPDDIAVSTPRLLSGSSVGTPAQENLNMVLDHAMANADTSLKYVGMMIAHVGGPLELDKDEPAAPGVLGKSFALRSQLQKLTLRLEQLGRML